MEGRGKTSLWGQEQQERKERQRESDGERERNRQAERERRRGERKRWVRQTCTEVLLVAEAVDISCQDLKGRPVRMPEY